MLKRLTTNDPLQRMYISLRQSTVAHLQAYRDNYRQVYGDEITQNKAIEAILETFMDNDKEFQKFLKNRTPPAAPEEEAVPDRTNPSDQAKPFDSQSFLG